MILDPKKTERQRGLYRDWVNVLKVSPVRAGIIEAVTGFGKTFIAIMAIKDMNERHPDRDAIVIVPTTKLKEDWDGNWLIEKLPGDKTKRTWIPGHIEKHALVNVRVFVVNTYVQYEAWKTDFLILDEAHHYSSDEAEHFNKVVGITEYRFGLALTATLNTKQQAFFARAGWMIVGKVDEEEAEREGYTVTSITYNLAVPLSEEQKKYNLQINETYKYYFGKFKFKFDLLKACSAGDKVPFKLKLDGWNEHVTKTGREWRLWWATRNQWDKTDAHAYSPLNISKYAAQAMRTMRLRKETWQNCKDKLPFVQQIVDKFPNMKFITFSEKASLADEVTQLFPGKALSYHTKLVTLAIRGSEVLLNPPVKVRASLKKEGFIIKVKKDLLAQAISLFSDPDSGINVINTVRKVDEGVDIPIVQGTIQLAYSSTERQDVQRSGRSKRIDYSNSGKIALNINLYMKGTQEERWLRNKQGEKLVRWVESVDEINLGSVELAPPRPKPKPGMSEYISMLNKEKEENE